MLFGTSRLLIKRGGFIGRQLFFEFLVVKLKEKKKLKTAKEKLW